MLSSSEKPMPAESSDDLCAPSFIHKGHFWPFSMSRKVSVVKDVQRTLYYASTVPALSLQLNADLLRHRVRSRHAVLSLCLRPVPECNASRKMKESLAGTEPVRSVDRGLLHQHDQSLSNFNLALPLHCSARTHPLILDCPSCRKPRLLYWTQWASATQQSLSGSDVTPALWNSGSIIGISMVRSRMKREVGGRA